MTWQHLSYLMGAMRVWLVTHSVDWEGQGGGALTRQLPQNLAQSILRSWMGSFYFPWTLYPSKGVLLWSTASQKFGGKTKFCQKWWFAEPKLYQSFRRSKADLRSPGSQHVQKAELHQTSNASSGNPWLQDLWLWGNQPCQVFQRLVEL